MPYAAAALPIDTEVTVHWRVRPPLRPVTVRPPLRLGTLKGNSDSKHEPDTTTTTVRRVPSGQDHFGEFYRCLARWRADTAHLSLVKDKINHPDFQRIVAMGDPAVPLIIEEIRYKPDFLV